MGYYRPSFTVPVEGVPHSTENARKAARYVLIDNHRSHGVRPTSRLQSLVYPPAFSREEALTIINKVPVNRFSTVSALALVVPVYRKLEKSREGIAVIQIPVRDEINWRTLVEEGLEAIKEDNEIVASFSVVKRDEHWAKGVIDIKVGYVFSASPDKENDVESYEIAII